MIREQVDELIARQEKYGEFDGQRLARLLRAALAITDEIHSKRRLREEYRSLDAFDDAVSKEKT